MEGKAPIQFKNTYYDPTYDDAEDANSDVTQYNKNKNPPKNMDLISEKPQFFNFYSETRKNERKTVLKTFVMYADLHKTILVLDRYILIPVPTTILTKHLLP